MTEATKALGTVTATDGTSCRVAVGAINLSAKVLDGVAAEVGSRVALLRISDQWVVGAKVVVVS